jgi:dTDP-4-dehydrorhamnose reductase
MATLLITGGSGFVGRNLAEVFSRRWSVVATSYRSNSRDSLELDVREADAVISAFKRAAPDVVIHAAGNKNVRFCEEHPDEAHQVNAIGTQNVARACRQSGAHLIYLSTDLVFDGQRGQYREDEQPQPASAYGISKLEGEKLARAELPEVAVCRSGGIYGKGSPLLRWLSEELNAGRSVDCFADVFNSPTYVENLAEMMETIIDQRLSGIFHTAGRERVSRFEFFQTYARTVGLNQELLKPVAASPLESELLLQPDSSLSVAQTAHKLGVTFNSVAEGFARLQAAGGV